LNCRSTSVAAEIVEPHSDDAVNRQNYKTERHLLGTGLMTDAADAAAAAEKTSVDAAERTDWKTGPASVIDDTP